MVSSIIHLFLFDLPNNERNELYFTLPQPPQHDQESTEDKKGVNRRGGIGQCLEQQSS